MFTNERLLGFIIIALIFGSGIYFAVTKFNRDINTAASPSPSPAELTFYLTQASTPIPQPQVTQQPQQPQVLGNTNTQAGPSQVQSPQLPLLTNKKLGKFPGMLTEEEIKNKAVTLVTSKGNIVMEIFPDAPKAASNFLLLVSNGFYDNLTFHRAEPGFLIQGGDPKGDGTGDGGYTFEDEPINREYTKGTVAMANRGENTNGTQFFIVISDNAGIPKKYTIFGTVIFGMDVVERIEPKDIIYKAVVQPLR